MELLIGASLVSAFIAGIAALFAPCCITVLLPAYLGSVFRQRRTIFLMTFIFFLGLLVVFLPIGLGAAGLGQLFSQYHNLIFTIGGIFLMFLAASILLGRHFSMPFQMHTRMKVDSSASIFGLGVFSGFATLCCAPVLAGVFALAVLPGSVFWGGMYSVVYVLGMVIPLFILSYFLDRTDFTKKFLAFRRQFSYPLAGRRISLTLADIISGVTFLSMGILILYLAQTGQLTMGGEYQTTINIQAANLANFVNQSMNQILAASWILLFIGALALIIKISVSKMR